MVTGPEARILARLASFPTSLESAWDVPRDICLPGLAEYLGVVRSALHGPLNELVRRELLIERKAHVIGGGSRRRKVYHITELGRIESDDIELGDTQRIGELMGKPPSQRVLQGRQQLISKLKSEKKMILTGLPGIGKTSLLRVIADELVNDGKIVRFATMESFKDIVEIIDEWEYNYTSEEAVINSSKNEVLILDELQEVSPRHLARLEIFASKAHHLVMASRAPLPFSDGFTVVEIPPLEVSDAVELLPSHIENRELVAQRLGGHPLALQMYDEESVLPEAGSDLQKWIKDVVLSNLGEEIKALDELSLIPVPIPCELLQYEQYLFDLDEHALLRWPSAGVELHHLVRNVRSTMLTQQDFAKAATYWSQIDGDLARLVQMHHMLNSGGDIETLLIRHAESLMVRSSAGLASLIGDAIFRQPTPALHRIAAMVAIERGESDIASYHLANCSAPDLEYSLSILNGEKVDLPDNPDIRLIISEASRRMDDRLPENKVNKGVLDLIAKVDLTSIEDDLKKVILVAIAHVRHAWYLSEEDWGEAHQIRESLEMLSHRDDPQLQALNLRAKIAETTPNSPTFEKLVDQAFTRNGLRAKMIQLSLISKCDAETAKTILNRIDLPTKSSQTNLSSARRIAAMIWYYRAKYKTHNPLSAMAEAISLWKISLCPSAAKEASELMHQML